MINDKVRLCIIMEKIKIAHVANTDFFIEKLMLNKLIGLRSLGYEVHAIAPSGIYEADVRKEGIYYHSIPIKREISLGKDILSILKMYKLFRREDFTVVHTHSAKAGFIGRVAAKMAGVPVIMHTTHGLPFYEGQSRMKFHIYKNLEKLAGKTCDVILSQNNEDINNLIKYKIGSPENIFYEGNGVNIEQLDNVASKVNKQELKKLLRVDGKSIVGFYARLEPVKGHLFFLESLKRIIEKDKDVVCLLAGSNFGYENKYTNVIMEKIKELNLSNNVKVLGFREDIHQLLCITDVLVLPSQKEGIPRIAMEAMTLGVPVVATDVLGTREIVINNETGILVPYNNVKTLAEAILQILEEPELRERLSVNGRERIEKFFDERQVIKRLHSSYMMLMKKHLVENESLCKKSS